MMIPDATSIVLSGALIAMPILLKLSQSVIHRKRLFSIPSRILVNGSRGKTDVTRLIAAGLRAGGMRVAARTTGVYPKFIDSNGESHREPRSVPARMDELVKFISRASKKRVETVVVECMALNPLYQELTQDKLIQSQIGVITNVRLDHLDTMGNNKRKIAESLSLTIPRNGTLFTAETECLSILMERAKSLHCKLIPVAIDSFLSESDVPANAIRENIALALSVCSYLGVSRQTALEGMANCQTDEGAFVIKPFSTSNGKLYFASAMAANDPESTSFLLQKAREAYPEAPLVGLYCHRKDRPWRHKTFSEFISTGSFDEVYYTDRFHRVGELIDRMETLPPGSLVFAFGNYRGWGEKLMQEMEERCFPKQ